MKHLIKRISRVADCSSADTTAVAPPYRLLRRQSAERRPTRRSRSATGQVPVYVGEEMRRFVVSAELVNHPVFANVLNRWAQIQGFQQEGALHIPCHVSDFERVVDGLRPGGRGISSDLVNSISPGGVFL